MVQVSFNDALRYWAWTGKRLPTEAEWEFAARGGLAGAAFPWGDEREPAGGHRMNVWQGRFPTENTLADGYDGTCPVDAFPPPLPGRRPPGQRAGLLSGQPRLPLRGGRAGHGSPRIG